MDLTPTQSPAEFAAPLMGLAPLGDDRGPTLLMDLTPTQSPAEFTAPLIEFPPL